MCSWILLLRRQAARLTALKSLAELLATPLGAAAAAGQLVSVWPATLALLWDRSAAVRGAVIPTLGRLGAIAADPSVTTSGHHLYSYTLKPSNMYDKAKTSAASSYSRAARRHCCRAIRLHIRSPSLSLQRLPVTQKPKNPHSQA